MAALVKDRYKLLCLIGAGSFGHVYEAYDYKQRKRVAIKCVKRCSEECSSFLQKFREHQILKTLQAQSRKNKYFVKLYDSFSTTECDYFVFELLRCNLYESMKSYVGGIPLNVIAAIGYDLCKALGRMGCVRLKGHGKTSVIHGDLKLNNVMFTDETLTSIKIIDFGTSFFGHDTASYNFNVPESYFLKNPKITPAIDMWNVGAILFNLFANKIMFRTYCGISVEIANLVSLFGEPSAEIMGDDCNLNIYFDRNGDKLVLKSKYRALSNQKSSFLQLFKRAAGSPLYSDQESILWIDTFYDLLIKMLDLDPDLRIKPGEAIKHRFFRIIKKSFVQKVLEKFK